MAGIITNVFQSHLEESILVPSHLYEILVLKTFCHIVVYTAVEIYG